MNRHTSERTSRRASADVCPECSAPVPSQGICRDNFHALLLLESQIPGGPGGVSHFYAVAAYNLQHPLSMNFTAEALHGLLRALEDVLDGRATLEQIRHRTRRAAERAGRVTRREGDATFAWPTRTWPATVADVLAVRPDASDYAEAVMRWARAVRHALNAEDQLK